jgi:hypothetical protein
MKKDYIVAVLLFGGLWGISEAVLGDFLYSRNVPYASVPLAVIGFILLTFAGAFFPRMGTATAVAAFAMLYKFLNAPFFACHILGIVLLGASYDLVFFAWRIRNRAIGAAAASYLGYASFALAITYVFRYEHWLGAGLPKVAGHVGVSGTMAAAASAILVPLAFRLAQRSKDTLPAVFAFRGRLVPSGASFAVAVLWIFAIAAFLAHG